MSGGFTTAQDGALATVVLADQLGGFITPEKEDFLATQYELTTGIVLRRSTEEIVDGMKPEEQRRREAKYQARYATFRAERPAVPKRELVMDPAMARKTLDQMERSFRVAVKPRTKIDRERAEHDYSFMNNLRSLLGQQPHDYATTPLPDPGQLLASDYHRFQQNVEPEARIQIVRGLTNLALVRAIAANDPSERVRVVAEDRFGALQVFGRSL